MSAPNFAAPEYWAPEYSTPEKAAPAAPPYTEAPNPLPFKPPMHKYISLSPRNHGELNLKIVDAQNIQARANSGSSPRTGTTFQIMPPLYKEGDEVAANNMNSPFYKSNKDRLVSIQTAKNPPTYLRHSGYQLRNHPYEESSLFRLDSTFYMNKEESDDGEYYTFRAINFHSQYLMTESDMKIYLRQPDDSETLRERASFVLHELH